METTERPLEGSQVYPPRNKGQWGRLLVSLALARAEKGAIVAGRLLALAKEGP